MPTSPARSSKGQTSAARPPGFTASQLYSTASYASGDLTGIGLGGNDLTGWNFANQNLTNANLCGSTLTNANFTRRDRQRGKLQRHDLPRLYRQPTLQHRQLRQRRSDGYWT